eukprot:m.677646 g.677646  ORF g.677646 m.677646 type:complete len:742 (-) comp22799_c0_seq4:163-2388(-)
MISKRQDVRMCLAVVAPIVVGVLLKFSCRLFMTIQHVYRDGFFNLSPSQRRVGLYSENAFYFSFAEGIANENDLWKGLDTLIHDDRSEAPTTINAWNRFNLVQELIVALVHKWGFSGWDLAVLYAVIVVGLTSVQFVTLTCTAAVAGVGNNRGMWHWIAAAVPMCVCASLLVTHVRPDAVAYTRFFTNFVLRENTAAPFVWLQVASVMAFLRQWDKSAPGCVWGSSVLCLLTWQFAPFLMFVHMVAASGVYAAGFIPTTKVTRLFRVFGAASVCASVIMMGNSMMLLSMATCTALVWEVLTIAEGNRVSTPLGFSHRVLKTLVAIAGGVSVKILLLGRVLGMGSDSHIAGILRAKIDQEYNDFQSLVYLCDGAFQTMPSSMIDGLIATNVLPYAACSALIIALLSLTSIVAAPGPEIMHKYADLAYLLLVTIGFGVLAISIVRLAVLWIPALILQGSLLVSPRMCDVLCDASDWTYDKIIGPTTATPAATRRSDVTHTPSSKGKKGRRATEAHTKLSDVDHVEAKGQWATTVRMVHFLLSLLVLRRVVQAVRPVYAEITTEVAHVGISPSETATLQLTEWLTAHYDDGTIVATDGPLSSHLRCLTKFRIVQHPHAEDYHMRIRHETLYQQYNRVPEEAIRNTLVSHFGAKVLVLSRGPCYLKCRPKTLLWNAFQSPNLESADDMDGYMVEDVANATRSDGTVGTGDPTVARFCEKAIESPQSLKHFTHRTTIGPFTVLDIL